MSQETWEIVQNREVNGIELQLALQCAPLIAGLKVSNLLNISREDFSAVKEIVRNSYISWYPLLERGNKMTILLYHRKSLEHYLEGEGALKILREAGYQNLSFEGILEEFRIRYRRYMEEREDFPHEMGVLLGYSVEDVEGFMKYKGDGFLCSGYWKVYADKEGKQRLFADFENAKERMIRLLSNGSSMEDIMAVCGRQLQKDAIPVNFTV